MSSNRSEIKNPENQAIERFMAYKENTMNEVVSASVGKVLLNLYDTYIHTKTDLSQKSQDPNNNESLIDDLYDVCFQEMQAAISKNEQKNTYESALKFINKKVDEQMDQFDTFAIYDPTQTIHNYITPIKEDKQKQIYAIPLKLVLVLVWYAINDDKAYLHNYVGTDAEKLAQAEGDKNNRLSNFFQCLMRIQNDTVCHHGNRNELVFTINQTYQDVDIIEDAAIAIYAYLKENLFKAFHEAYQKEGSDKEKLKTAFIIWSEENDPNPLIELISPTLREELRAGLDAHFLKHGSNINDKAIANCIDQAFQQLECYCDSKLYPVFSMVDSLLKQASVSNLNFRDKALEFFQKWIKTTYVLNNPDDEKKIANFYMIYSAHKLFTHYKSLLTLTGKITDDVITFEKFSEDYFQKLAEGNFSNLTLDDVVLVTKVSKLIDSLKTDRLVSSIENFFSAWFSNERETLETKERLYLDMLNNPLAQDKIKLSDAEIQNFIASANSANEKDITPYEINRVFLHAIIVNPEVWSESFYKAFSAVLDFVKKGFNNNNNQLTAALKADSYPKGLLDQLNYLDARYNGKIVPRPPDMILLPTQIQTVDDWVAIVKLLRNNSVLHINTYRRNQVYLQKLLSDQMDITNISKIMYSVPNDYCIHFTKRINDIIIHAGSLNSVAHSLLLEIPGRLNPTDRKAYFEELGNELVLKIIKATPLAYYSILCSNNPNIFNIIESFDRSLFKDLFSSYDELVNQLDFVSPKNRIKLIKCLDQHNLLYDKIANIKSHELDKKKFFNIFKMLPSENLFDFLTIWGSSYIKRMLPLAEGPGQEWYWWEARREGIEHLEKLLEWMPPNYYTRVLQLFERENLLKCLNESDNLTTLLNSILPDTNRRALLYSLDECGVLQNYLERHNDYVDYIYSLPNEERFDFIMFLSKKYDLRSFIKNASSLFFLLDSISKDLHYNILSILGNDHLMKIIKIMAN